VAGDTGPGPAAKKKSHHAAEQDRPDVKAARNAWFYQFARIRLNQLVFIDEFGATTNMTRRYARGPRGQRVVCKTPHGHWKILSTIAALDVNGIRTACCFDGATDTEIFVAFVETFLVPTLRPGQVVVMDNLSAHKSPRVDRAIEAAGARVLRLPPYSPDFNPIEMAISKMKSLLRKLGRRSIDHLEAAIGQATQAITRSDARAFITHCGYGDTHE
jgi:transposase